MRRRGSTLRVALRERSLLVRLADDPDSHVRWQTALSLGAWDSDEILAPLARIAFNYRWSWLPGGPELFQAVDAERFALCHQNPVRLLQEAPSRTLRRAAGRFLPARLI